MLREYYKCPCCGEVFKGNDIIFDIKRNDNRTEYNNPRCPYCKSKLNILKDNVTELNYDVAFSVALDKVNKDTLDFNLIKEELKKEFAEEIKKAKLPEIKFIIKRIDFKELHEWTYNLC